MSLVTSPYQGEVAPRAPEGSAPGPVGEVAPGRIVVALVAILLSLPVFAAPPRVLDDLETVDSWKAAGSDGIEARLTTVEGCRGRGLRLDYDFRGGSGYAIARRPLHLKLPAEWAFSFCLRAEGSANDIELKFVDPAGVNVWWWRRKGLGPSGTFERVVVKKRHVSFAWGPQGGGELKETGALEIAVVAGSGGKGSLFLDDFVLEERSAEAKVEPPRITASSSAKGFEPGVAFDGERETAWRSKVTGKDNQWLQIAFGQTREMGGVVVRFEKDRHARAFSLGVSDDGSVWRTLRDVEENRRTTSWLAFPETEARYLRLVFRKGTGDGYGVAEIEPMPPSFSDNSDTLIYSMAKESRRGTFPRAYSGEQTYWTVAGVDGDPEEVLVSEDGAIEPGTGSFSLEPFLLVEDTLLDWSKVRPSWSLFEGFLPIPTVTSTSALAELSVTTLVDGAPGASVLRARYRVRNTGTSGLTARLFVAIRPFLVNPPSQFLNAPHGVSRINSLAWDGKMVLVNGSRSVVPLVPPASFGTAAFDSGDLVDLLGKGLGASSVQDPTGLASGAFTWNLEIPAGSFRDVVIAAPLHRGAAVGTGAFEDRLVSSAHDWKDRLHRVSFIVPKEAQALVATLKSNLSYVLVNRDGPAIQPGSRAYERSWIRDGALTSSALLRLGHEEAARDFLVWFAGYQFANGKIPCCVDKRGADPVPENDSHGEFLYLAAEYLRFTGDTRTLSDLWPRIEKTVGYIDTLRHQRRTAEFEKPESRAFYGLMPESISHEGYSDKPMHSYWDDFFALKGLKDAVFMARAMGKESQTAAWSRIRDEFESDLSASLARTIATSGIDYVPGCVEKNDFDPTSTTVALSPAGAEGILPPGKLERTFERYVLEARERRDGKRKSEVYTPYELRTVGALVRLGKKAEALEMLDFFMKDRRPAAWNQWAEVVGTDPREKRFIGDMPHTWVGTDFIRSFLDFFSYERDRDSSLVLGAGIPEAWVRNPGGVSVTGLRTPYGPLDFSMSASAAEVRVRIGRVSVPPGGLVVAWPLDGDPREAIVNGRKATIRGREILVRDSPAEIVIR